MPAGDTLDAVRLSLDVAARAVGFGLPVCVLLGWVLSRLNFPGRFLLAALVNLPLILPPVVTGWLLLLLFGVEGPFGRLLFRAFGLRLPFTTAGAALACMVMIAPIMTRMARLGFDQVDPRLEQAARSLGAGPLDRFLSIVLPLSLPAILAGAVLGFAASLGEFGAVITFAASIPGETRTLPLAIYGALQRPGGEAQAAQLALISVALAFAGLFAAEALGRVRNLRIA